MSQNSADKVFAKPIVGPGTFAVDIVGESHCQDVLERLSGGRQQYGVMKETIATLVSEPKNPRDPNAVRVEISGQKVGYLDKDRAAKIRHKLQRLGFDHLRAPCHAMIVGGAGSHGRFGVKLDIYTKKQKASEPASDLAENEFAFAPMLPSESLVEKRVAPGTEVRFWHPEGSDRILVFPADGTAGPQNLGLVPKKYFAAILQELERERPIPARLVDTPSGQLAVQGRFLTEEEAAQREADIQAAKEEWARRRNERLRKPYRPKKPVRFQRRMEKNSLKKGERLEILDLPSSEQVAAMSNAPAIRFRSLSSGDEFAVGNDLAFQEKVLRLTHTYDEFDVKVVGRETPRNSYWTYYAIEITPRQSDGAPDS